MNSLKRLFTGIIAMSCVIYSSVSCSSKKNNSDEESEVIETTDATIITEPPIEENFSITWLSDYDLNPSEKDVRSSALALFEDYYDGEINYISVNYKEKYSTLNEMILCGQEVDMFPYEADAFPVGVIRNHFEPLDPYYDELEMDSDIWSDMTEIIDMFKYNDGHYVIPYDISNPIVITYDKNLIAEHNLDDPYTLYKDGKWDWESFMSIMETFISSASDGSAKYGIGGDLGKALLHSTGQTIISSENGKFINNIADSKIKSAELLMQEIAEKGLYNSQHLRFFSSDNSTLFYVTDDWFINSSIAENPDSNLMIVPFPKQTGNDSHYVSCDFDARMLVKNSKKGKAVATYIKCERTVTAEKSYIEKANTTKKGLMNDEQFNSLMECYDLIYKAPLFDFGYGMGEKMYSNNLNYLPKGVMDNLLSVMLENSHEYESLDAFINSCSDIINEEISNFNN